MNPLEQKIYYPLAELRTVAFRPFNKIFSALGISADMISYLGVSLMIVFIFVVPNHKVAAFWLVFFRMIADIMDGPLARFQKTDSDRGKFVDVLMDVSGFALFTIGLAGASVLNALPACLFLFSVLLVVVLMTIRYNFKHTSKNWFFFASAGSFPHNFIYASYGLFALYAFGGHNYLNGAVEIFSALLLCKALSEYWAIQKSTKT